MCGRYAITLAPEAMAHLFEATWADGTVPNLAPRYNVAPTTDVPVMAIGKAGRTLLMMRWGLVPSWSKRPGDGPLLINARSETVAEKPAFRTAYRKKRRCLVPADGFYEWRREGPKIPYYVCRSDGAPMVFAGLWEHWSGADGDILSCTLITTDAPKPLADIHHRCPVILEVDGRERWLAEDDPRDLLAPPSPEVLTMHRVSTRVNAVRNDDPDLVQPVEDDDTAAEEV